MTDADIRNAAEALLAPSNSYSLPNSGLLHGISAVEHLEQQISSTHNSLSSLDGPHLEEIASGARRNGRMSAVRRSFCCFVLFDLLLVSLTWLICLMVMDSKNIIEILKKQILNYNITNSLFDLVLAALCRFTILLLFYGVIQLNTTFFVAVTTFATCIFLIFKVIYYSWDTASQPAFQGIIILMSFIVAWLEAWFFDSRVIPQEIFALRYAQTTGRFSESLNNLIISRNLRYLLPQMGADNESTGNFYSPLESPDDSDEDLDDKRVHSKLPNNDLLRQGENTLEIAWTLLNDSDWRLQKKVENGDSVYSKHQKHLGKIFLLRTKIDIKAETLLQELFNNVDTWTKWNKTIFESKRVLFIDDHTDITYQVSSPSGNGVISSRDFINLRHWNVKEGVYVLAGISVPYPSIPSNSQYIRGENGPCCWAMRPLPDNVNCCTFEFLLNTNLKGWIPQYVVDAALSSVLLEYSSCLKEHCKTLFHPTLT